VRREKGSVVLWWLGRRDQCLSGEVAGCGGFGDDEISIQWDGVGEFCG